MLRPALPGEIERLRRIDMAARTRYAVLPGFERAVTSPPIAAERFATGETVVAERDGEPVGFALLQPLDGMLYLAIIAVTPQAGRQGVGAALLRHAAGRAAAEALAAVTLTTFRLPPWNGPWFRRHGYAPIPEERIGPGLRAVLARHATFLDMTTRETLWRPVTASDGR